MRAAAAESLKRVQAALNTQPGTPLAILCGDHAARCRVRESLGCPVQSANASDSVCAEVLDGLVLVEPPEIIRKQEATELATFLKGSQYAHGVILAIDVASPTSSPPVQEDRSEALPVLAEFYSSKSFKEFLAVAVTGQKGADADTAVSGRLQHYASHSSALDCLSTEGAAPNVFLIDEVAEVSRLFGHLRSCRPVPFEPHNSSSPLLFQFKAIQQKLSQLPRPPSAGSSAQTSRTAPAETARTAPPELSKLAGRKMTAMVFGKTGAGKSHLANLLVGFKAFEVADGCSSVTGSESVRRAETADGTLTVLDSVGFGDTRLEPEAVVRSLRDTALEAPVGIDALFFVMKKERVSAIEQEIFLYVTQMLFGPACLPNLYIIVTHAGRLSKEVEMRRPWLQEQLDASPLFAGMVALLGPEPARRVLFIENADPEHAEDNDERLLAEKKRDRGLDEIYSLLARHTAEPYRHGIMEKACELRNAHLEELKRELRSRIESEVRQQLARESDNIEEERRRLEVDLKDREADMQKKFEAEWERMRGEFTAKAAELARADLEPLAQDIVEQTEKKHKGKRCTIM